MTKVAVITRTKDRPLFLARAIKSVAAQTYKEYEHLIVNDGGDHKIIDDIVASLDSTVAAMIRVHHRDVSSGAPDTIFNESIDMTTSEYIAIHDDDDTWHPEFLERVTLALEAGENGVLVRTDRVTEEINESDIRIVNRQQYLPDMHAVSLFRQCVDNQLTPIAFAYRRETYEEVGKYDAKLPVVGDWEYGIRFLKHSDVAYLDPGFALAGYHKRRSGDNSFKDHDHRTYLTKVLNAYLRDDIQKGKYGVGHIMNSLWYEKDTMSRWTKKMLPSSVVKLVRSRLR